MAAEPTTDGNVATETTTDTPTATATDTGTDRTDKGAEGRIASLTAQLQRAKDRNDKLESKINEIIEANKSEEDKKLEQRAEKIAEERYGGRLQELERWETELKDEVAKALEGLPAESRSYIDELAPPQVQLRQIRLANAMIQSATGKRLASGAPMNPGDGAGGERIYSNREYQDWLRSSSSMDPKVKAKFWELKPEMEAAAKSGRVKG